jgi:outer membrane protein insertion porin family
MTVLSFSEPTMAANSAKKVSPKNEKSHLEPSLREVSGTLSFDNETKAALARSKEPGLIVAQNEEAGHIKSIKITNSQKVEYAAVLLRLKSKIGGKYNKVTLMDDVDEIYNMGLFSNVEVYEEILASGAVALEFRLYEIPTIFQIKIEGNSSLSADEIKEAQKGLENYQGAKLSRLEQAAKQIRELYVSKGFYLANVDYSLKPSDPSEIKKREKEGISEQSTAAAEIDTANVTAPDFVDVIFKIQENNKVKINRIVIMGAHGLDQEEILANLRTREEHVLSVVTDWGIFRKDFLEVDAFIIEKLLHDNGYLMGKVLEPEIDLSGDKEKIAVTFRLIEGDQYSLGKLAIQGNLVEQNELIYRMQKDSDPDKTIFSAAKLLKEIHIKSGEIFNKSKMAEGVMAIAEKYRDIGYAYANVSPVPTFHDEEKIVDIDIQVESGPLVSIERIDIEGNNKTVDRVIRRELSISEGELFSASNMRISESNVRRLGYFENVEFSTSQGSRDDLMVVTIKVKEQNTGNIQGGAGYGTGGEGIVLRAQVSNQNLFGRGQTLSAMINWSKYRNMIDVMFVEPYLTYMFDNPISFAFTVYNRDVFMGEFNRKATGGDITLGYPIGGPLAYLSRKWKARARPDLMPYVLDFGALWFYLTYTAERVEINDTTTKARLWGLQLGVPRYTSSLKTTISLDQRDNRLFPTSGLYFDFRSEFANEYFGAIGLEKLENSIRRALPKNRLKDGRSFMKADAGSNNFMRFGTNFRFYYNFDSWFPLKGWVLKSNIEFGILNTLGNPLLFENYALGGVNTVRGYPYRSISPVERAGPLFPFDPRPDVRVGGNKQFYASLELEFPIIKALKISGVLFADFGNVYSSEDNFFYIGGRSKNAARIHPSDPLRLYEYLGIYSSLGFGVRWLSPLGYLRFEWGIPLNRRPAQTPGLSEKDPPILFEFNYGPSF